MTTQVIFNIDKKLKDQAMKKAAGQGITYSTVLKLATRAFVENRFDIDVVIPEPFNQKTRQAMSEAIADVKKGKNLSPRFRSRQEMVAFFKS